MNLRFVEIKSEIGAGTRGSSLGIDALKISSVVNNKSFFTEVPSIEVPDENRMLFKEYIKLFEKYNLENNIVFLKHFSKRSLEHAKKYLKSDNIEPYKISEFRVMSSLEEK